MYLPSLKEKLACWVVWKVFSQMTKSSFKSKSFFSGEADFLIYLTLNIPMDQWSVLGY